MRRIRAPELGLVVLSLSATAPAEERAAPHTAQQRAAQQRAPGTPDDRETVSPARRLEAEIEDYPEPAAAADEAAQATIPEMVEEIPRAAAPSKPPRRSASEMDRSQVQRVLGQDATVMRLSDLDARQLTLLQQRLRERGLYLGRIDGVAGPETRAAVRALVRERFALERRLLQQGQVTSQLAELMGITPRRAP